MPIKYTDWGGVYKYKVIDYSNNLKNDKSLSIIKCVEQYSKKYYKYIIKHNKLWYNEVAKKAKLNKMTIEEALDTDAEWMETNYYNDRFNEIKNNFSLDKTSENIKTNKDLLSQIKTKALLNSITIDEQLKLDVIWSFEQNKIYKKIQGNTVHRIMNNKAMYLSLKQKAKQNGISLESQLLFDAQWIIELEFNIDK